MGAWNIGSFKAAVATVMQHRPVFNDNQVQKHVLFHAVEQLVIWGGWLGLQSTLLDYGHLLCVSPTLGCTCNVQMALLALSICTGTEPGQKT